LKYIDDGAIASVGAGSNGKLVWVLLELPLGAAMGKHNTITVVDAGSADIFYFPQCFLHYPDATWV